jgi:phospholipid-binding lipoprotein MlaA
VKKILCALTASALLLSACSTTEKTSSAPGRESPEKSQPSAAAKTNPAAGAKTPAAKDGLKDPAATRTDARETKADGTGFKESNSPDLMEDYGGRDSLEPFNRAMFTVNKCGFRYVVQPVAIFWGSLIPKHAIECFNRFTDNVAFPRRTVSCLLQAKFDYAGLDMSRFLINSTVGVAGFYDPAYNWFGIEQQDEDFGQAFACWGIGAGPCMHLPSIGPTNIRDGVGKIFDYALDPKSYIYGGQAFTMLNEGTYRYRELDNFMRSNSDPYELAKRLFAAQRYVQINDYDRRKNLTEYQKALMKEAAEIENPEDITNPPDNPKLETVEIPGFKSQGPDIDTLRCGFVGPENDKKSMWVDVSFWNSDFFNQGSVRSVEVIPGKPEMEYKVWRRKDKNAPLAVIVPGAGAHYTNDTAVAVAECMFNNGFTTVTISNAMNWAFLETAASVPTPGFNPRDAEDVRNAVKAVVEDLQNSKGLTFPAKIMIGQSLGAAHTMFIGASEGKDDAVKFDRFVAVNPPVDMKYAIGQIDKLNLAWKKWHRDEVFKRGVVAAVKMLAVMKDAGSRFNPPAPDQKSPGSQSPSRTAGKDQKTTCGQTAGKDQKTADSQSATQTGKDQKTADSQSASQTGKDQKAAEPSAPANMDLRQTADSVAEDKLAAMAAEAGAMPFTDTEARALIGYSFRLTLNEMILTVIRNNPDMNIFKSKCTWGDRTEFYREINEMTFMGYVKDFVVKYYSDLEKTQLTLDDLNKRASLRTMEKQIRENQKLFVIHSANDFLESPSDRDWLKSVMGSRCVFLKCGGHLGDLWFKEFFDIMSKHAEEVKKLSDSRTAADKSSKDKSMPVGK